MAKCMTPFAIKDENKTRYYVDCGKCPACKKKRTAQWAFRLMNEAHHADYALFVTLTYSDKHIKVTRRTKQQTLFKPDVQKFFKRLRKNHKGKPIKYYLAGEYGGETQRPHYHIILFNATKQQVLDAWSLDGKALGRVHFGQKFQGACVGYTLKYISKEKQVPMWKGDKRHPEFSLMSKGIGAKYLTEAIKKWHKADVTGRYYVLNQEGHKIAMPKYYKKRIYSSEEKGIIKAFFEQQAIQYAMENQEKAISIKEAKEQYQQAVARMHKKAKTHDKWLQTV